MNRAYSLLTVKAVDEDARVIEGIATTPTADRMGDIVEPKGAEFKLPIPLLWQHKADKPIGHVIEAKVTAAGIRIKAQIAKIDEPGALKDRLDEAWQSIKTGLVQGLSIGFSGIESARIEGTYSYRFLKWLWLELSAVTIPANGEATITAIKSIDTELRAATGEKQHVVVRLDPPGATGTQSTKSIPAPKEGTTMKTIAEQIAAFEAELVAKQAKLNEIQSKALEEGRTKDASEKEEFDTLRQEIAAIEVELKDLRELEAAQAARAKAVGAPKTIEQGSAVRAGIVIKTAEKLDKGIGFARYAMVLAAAKGDITLAHNIAQNKFASDERLKLVMKAAVEAGTTTDPDWAGALVAHNELSTDFIEYLRPRTIIGQFGQGNVPQLRRVPFNIHIKGQNAKASAGWVGEGFAKPVTKAGYNDTYLGWAKVAAISVITEELARFSNPGAEALVRDELADAVIERIDTDLVDPTKAAGAGATASPASLTNGVTPITATGNDADSVRADIAALWATADSTNLPVAAAVYITDSRTARALSLMRNLLGQKEFPDITMTGGFIDGVPVIVSNYVPAAGGGSMFILAFASEIMLADDNVVTLSASREASIQMDTAPNQDAGTPTPAQLVSMFQTNSIALRAERYINWGKRRAQAVAFLQGVNWGGASAAS